MHPARIGGLAEEGLGKYWAMGIKGDLANSRSFGTTAGVFMGMRAVVDVVAVAVVDVFSLEVGRGCRER